MVGQYYSCELDCCFTEQDLLMDVISLADTYVTTTAAVSADLSSSSKNSSSRTQSNISEQQSGPDNDKSTVTGAEMEEEYLSLMSRCLHQQLSESLGAESDYSPQQSSSQKSVSSQSIEPNAFLLSVTLFLLIPVAPKVLD